MPSRAAPTKRAPSKKTPARKATTAKSTPRKIAPSKAAPRKAAAKKVPAKKTPAKKTVKRTPAKKQASKPPPNPKDLIKPPLTVAELQALATRLTPEGESDPPQLAWDLKVRGFTWVQVARAAGYASVTSAQNAVEAVRKRSVQESGPKRRAEALELADARYEELLRAHWDRAQNDVGEAEFVRKLIGDLTRLWHLTDSEVQSAVGRVIVIAGDREEFISGLKKVVAERELGRQNAPALTDAQDVIDADLVDDEPATVAVSPG